MNVHHSLCSTKTIAEVSSARDFPDKVTSIVIKLETLVQKAQELEEKSNNALINLEKMEHVCMQDIKDIRSQALLLFDKLQQNALDELKSKSNIQSNILKDLNTMVKNTVHLLNTDKSKVEEVNDSNQNKLVACSKINKLLPSYEAALDACQGKLIIRSVIFEKNPVLTDLHVNLDSLGTFSTPLLTPETGKFNFLDTEVTSHKVFDVKDTSDEMKPWISGIVFLKNGDLLVADHENGRLTLFDSVMNKKKASIKCVDPWDAAVLDDKQVLVTSAGILRYLHVGLNDTLAFTKEVKLDDTAFRSGVTVEAGLIYVHGSHDKNFILILDGNGTLQKTFMTEQIWESFSGGNRYYISVSSKNDQLYLQGVNRILSITTNGDLIRTYTNSAMKNARGLVIDDKDNLLIGCLESHNLLIFSCDGSKHKMLLSKEDQIAKPYGIAFRASDGTLAVGDWESGKLHVLTLASK